MKFIYLADTHIGGADNSGYHQQPRFIAQLYVLIDTLSEYLRDNPDISFVAHGGDLLEEVTIENIKTAQEMFTRLPCPVYLALGNHDMTVPGSIKLWLEYAPEFFPGNDINFSIHEKDVTLDFFCCNWGPVPYFWNPSIEQIPWLAPKEMLRLEWKDMKTKNRIAIMHSPIFGLPPEQTGMNTPLHPPAENFTHAILDAIDGTNIRLVLGAHNHMNMNILYRRTHFVTTSAFIEIPFEFKVVDAASDKVTMITISLNRTTGLPLNYDFNKTFVQGRLCDRAFSDDFQASME